MRKNPMKYRLESDAIVSKPFPRSTNTNPMKSSRGRKRLGLDRLRDMFHHLYHGTDINFTILKPFSRRCGASDSRTCDMVDSRTIYIS